MTAVLFVCLGNICRSPMAEAIMRQLIIDRGLDWQVDSAGTGAWHVGEPPDPRTVSECSRSGLRCDHRGRQIELEDFHRFDHILAMDQQNLGELRHLAPDDCHAEVDLLGSWDPEHAGDVPDPYYGGKDGFRHIFAQISRSCRHFLDQHA